MRFSARCNSAKSLAKGQASVKQPLPAAEIRFRVEFINLRIGRIWLFPTGVGRPIVSLSPADLDWLLSRPLLPLNCTGNAIGISSLQFAKEGIYEKRLIPDSVWQAGHTG
jgi:hypothetical protein